MSPATSDSALRLIFWPVLAPSFLFATGLGAIAPIQVLAALQLGASAALASALIAIAGIFVIFVTVPVGSAIDRLGDRRSMTTATLFASSLFILTALTLAFPGSWSLPIFIVALVLRAPATVAWGLARQAVVAETVASSQRGKAMTALGGAQRAGSLAGPLTGGVLLLWLPLWSVFIFAMIVTLLATALLHVRRLNARFEERNQQAKLAVTPDEISAATDWKAVLAAGLAVTTLAIARVTQPIIVALWGTHLGWNETSISLAVALGSALEMILMVPGAYIKDAWGRSITLCICLVTYGAGFLLTVLLPTSVGFMAGLAVMSAGNGVGAGINMTIGADLSPSKGRAKFLSIWALFSHVGVVGGPLILSGILLVSTLPFAVSAVGVTTLAGALWAITSQPITRLPTGLGNKNKR